MTAATLTCPTCQGQWSRRPLTRRQADLLSFLDASIQANRYAPSIQEIMAHFGFTSSATVAEHLANLQQKDYIVRRYRDQRSIVIVGSVQP